ncbi:MAG: sulfur carrier protein ThiS [Desulfobulbaceae bacterium]|nr:sulfur carrier protein ThiS [Desulfobulbaceae bacterium]HIJ77764.1 sulfur carrier protein ThiS [Deltaproteobacteria bacterium]
MQITVNGEIEQLNDTGVTISRLLEIKQVESPDMVSVQHNGVFIDREHYPTTILAANDELDFLYFMGGGAK